jgi:hypothetical protein
MEKKEWLITWQVDIFETADNPIEAVTQAWMQIKDNPCNDWVWEVKDKVTRKVYNVDMYSIDPEAIDITEQKAGDDETDN